MTSLSVADAFRATSVIVSIGVIVVALEWLTARRVWSDAGILSWRVIGLTYRDRGSFLGAVRDGAGRRAGTAAGLVAAIASAVVELAPAPDGVHTLALGTMAVTMALVRLRFLPPGDGGDQMLVVVLVALTFGAIVGTPVAAQLTIAFLAFQVVVAYLTAAWSKLSVADWRSGAVLADVLATDTFGTPRLRGWLTRDPRAGFSAAEAPLDLRLRGASAAEILVVGAAPLPRSPVARWLTWSVIVLELALPLALIAPPPVAVALLVGGAAFHLSTGLVMGINRFFWPYLALYPAVLAVNPWG